jgi:hypothetical protein
MVSLTSLLIYYSIKISQRRLPNAILILAEFYSLYFNNNYEAVKQAAAAAVSGRQGEPRPIEQGPASRQLPHRPDLQVGQETEADREAGSGPQGSQESQARAEAEVAVEARGAAEESQQRSGPLGQQDRRGVQGLHRGAAQHRQGRQHQQVPHRLRLLLLILPPLKSTLLLPPPTFPRRPNLQHGMDASRLRP